MDVSYSPSVSVDQVFSISSNCLRDYRDPPNCDYELAPRTRVFLPVIKRDEPTRLPKTKVEKPGCSGEWPVEEVAVKQSLDHYTIPKTAPDIVMGVVSWIP
jgi:hypothetical protein